MPVIEFDLADQIESQHIQGFNFTLFTLSPFAKIGKYIKGLIVSFKVP